MRRDGPRLAEKMREKYGIEWVLDRDVSKCMICDEQFNVSASERTRARPADSPTRRAAGHDMEAPLPGELRYGSRVQLPPTR